MAHHFVVLCHGLAVSVGLDSIFVLSPSLPQFVLCATDTEAGGSSPDSLLELVPFSIGKNVTQQKRPNVDAPPMTLLWCKQTTTSKSNIFILNSMNTVELMVSLAS